nr:nuclear RNA export factor 3-like [Equus caballus]
MGHNNQPNFLQRRARCWGIYRRRYSNWSEEVSSGIHPSSHQQQDEDPGKSDAPVDTGIRYAPYAIPPCHRRGTFQKQDQTHVNMEREQKPPERRTEGNKQDETSGSWFKIMVPFGIKYDEKWLLSLIQKQCSVPFTPVEFHYEKMQAQFFVENANIAFALKNINGKIWDKNNERISIFVSPLMHLLCAEGAEVRKVTFIIVPASNSSLCILNDQLFVRDANPKETHSGLFIPVPTPASSSVPTLSQEQQEMVQAFSTQSGMNLQWSQKCLHDSHWDYTKAAQVLALLKAQCKIPEEALTQTDPGS